MMNEQHGDTYTGWQLIIDLARDIVTSKTTWMLLAGALSVGIYTVDAFQKADQKAQQEAVIRQTPAGTFALNTMANCLASGTIFNGKPTDAECINQTLSVAQNLRGPAFAEDVKNVLSQKYIAN